MPGWAQQSRAQTSAANYAQSYSRKTWMVGVQAGRSRGLLLGNNLTAQIYGGYFITNNVMVGLSGAVSKEETEGIGVRDLVWSVGPTIRYQITRSRISPFVVASYQFGQRTVSGSSQVMGPTSGSRISGDNTPRPIQTRMFGFGVSIGIVPALRADLAINWQDKASAYNPTIRLNDGLFQPQFGLHYLISAKK